MIKPRCILGVIATLFYVCASANAGAQEGGKYIGDGVKDLPLFDAHIHYKEPAWMPYPPKAVLDLMDKSGVAMGLVSSTPDEGTIMLWKFAPERIVPELRPYHGNAGSSNWTKMPGMFEYLNKRLDSYPHQGIGEFHLHNVDATDETLLRKIVKAAKSRDIYIHVHSGKEPVEYWYSLEPDLKIIWAHAGRSEPAEVVETMMATYSTLYADTSFRERDILQGDGSIDPAWRKVIERFSDRFMIGSDTWINGQWDVYEELMTLNRQWIRFFARPIAEKIAYKNAEKLFGRKVGNHLIGQR